MYIDHAKEEELFDISNNAGIRNCEDRPTERDLFDPEQNGELIRPQFVFRLPPRIKF